MYQLVHFYQCTNVCISLQAVAGLLADAKHLVDNAREEAANYRANYGANIPLKVNIITLY